MFVCGAIVGCGATDDSGGAPKGGGGTHSGGSSAGGSGGVGTGGSATGGAGTGGIATGGSSTGGVSGSGTGGAGTGGTGTGGSSTGGVAGMGTGGTATGGTGTGGTGTGGTGTGGTGTGGTGTGGTGTGGTSSLPDSDGDKIPDAADPFPNDPTKPVVAVANLVYPHTSSTLFTMNPTTYAIATVGTFNGSAFSGSMTDLAIDQFGVIYGVTFNDLWTCDATTATCYHLATLPQSFNGLTMLPPGTHNPLLDTLVGIANSGDWYKVTLSGTGTAQLTKIGSYGTGYSSSGDAFSIENVGTFASVDKTSQSSDVIVSVDPMTGAVKNDVAVLNGYTAVYGLAGWQGKIFAFDETGAILLITLPGGTVSNVGQSNNAWWGAAVTTRLK